MEGQGERRRFVRLNVLTDVIYKKRAVFKKERLSLTKNIGKGGICLIAYEDLKEADILELRIYLPEDTSPVHAIGRVAWVKEFFVGDAVAGKRLDTGIEFIKISEQDLIRIDKYVFSHTSVKESNLAQV